MIYFIGLFFAILILLISVDDIIWDIYYFFNKITGKFKRKNITFQDVENEVPKMLAIVVAAYNEENVLGDVIRNMVLSSQYPDSMYHIFLGVYPNDHATQKVADNLSKEFNNVHKVLHYLDGPSSKADNLNNVIKNIYEFEDRNNIKFAAIVVHDSEDIIHPYEFKLENYLIEHYPAIQMPVFPIQDKSGFKNICRNLISGTYMDEFAENHYRLLVARTVSKSFVPSAGTGFTIRRDLLKSFPDNNVFPVGSLTEDYKLSLQFKQMGFDVHYALEDVHKLLDDGTIKKEFISTRSMFPDTYKAAVRQKTRWIYGITMQSFSLKNIIKNKELNLQSKYSLYRDWKAKFGNLLIGPGYLIFLYFILSYFFNLPVMYPKYSLSWYLMIFLSIIMIERQILRFTAIKKVYGLSEAIKSMLLPPLLPLRLVVGNIINFHATAKAWLTRFKIGSRRKTKKVKWSKTDHEFLEEQILISFRRNLGDILLYKGLIKDDSLKQAYVLSKKKDVPLKDILRENNLVSDQEIVKAICEVEHKTYIDLNPGRYLNYYVRKHSDKFFNEEIAIPLILVKNTLYVVTTLESDHKKIKKIAKKYNSVDHVEFMYSSKNKIIEAFKNPTVDEVESKDIIKLENYVIDGKVNVEQAIIALNYETFDNNIDDILNKMGIIIR